MPTSLSWRQRGRLSTRPGGGMLLKTGGGKFLKNSAATGGMIQKNDNPFQLQNPGTNTRAGAGVTATNGETTNGETTTGATKCRLTNTWERGNARAQHGDPTKPRWTNP